MNRVHEPRRRVFFHQRCPICGRQLDIDVSYLGAKVYCQHCGGRFIAMDASLGPVGATVTLGRADELLARASTRLAEIEAPR